MALWASSSLQRTWSIAMVSALSHDRSMVRKSSKNERYNACLRHPCFHFQWSGVLDIVGEECGLQNDIDNGQRASSSSSVYFFVVNMVTI